jgi:hypothetical protein
MGVPAERRDRPPGPDEGDDRRDRAGERAGREPREHGELAFRLGVHGVWVTRGRVLAMTFS